MSNKTYTYGNTQWGDQLTGFNGTAITYDAIGNPLSYYNGNSYTFTWSGRQLTGAIKGDKTMSFTYNDEGIRTSKTVNGVTTTYYLNGSQIVAEETNGNLTLYIYDSEGLPQGMQYRGASYASGVWDVYYFERNIFGDIVAVYGQNGTKLISYTYDAWGRQTVTYTNNGASTTAANNPFRYRGYYYDAYLNLYYLNARYYDQNTGRFISPDDALYHSMLGYNMYAYCNNNPVSFYDPTGESAEALAEVAKKYCWLVFLDGQLPIADILFALFLLGVFVAAAGVGEAIAEASQADSTSDSKPKAEEPPKSVDEAEKSSSNEANNDKDKTDKRKDTQKNSKYKSKKAAPRIKSNSKKAAREKAFLKGGKRPPIHHPHGKFGPHFHPNKPKFSHWHFYYIFIFSTAYQE